MPSSVPMNRINMDVAAKWSLFKITSELTVQIEHCLIFSFLFDFDAFMSATLMDSRPAESTGSDGGVPEALLKDSWDTSGRCWGVRVCIYL